MIVFEKTRRDCQPCPFSVRQLACECVLAYILPCGSGENLYSTLFNDTLNISALKSHVAPLFNI